ncbi:MAG: precorrin-8X methylmutase, partial [Dehalococcoidia bacterium]|nr:precorrin-8X methylmutase [Dehalococcoidia bacterium]
AVRFSPGAVERGVAALRGRAQVITDVRMVEVGISKALLSSRKVSTRCVIANPEVAARAQKERTTRSVAAMRELAPYMDGAVVAVGNAPTALLAVLDLVNQGRAAPALVIGMPVGFVACAESKEELLSSSVPHICIREYRGGSSAAAATVNTLLSLAEEPGAP